MNRLVWQLLILSTVGTFVAASGDDGSPYLRLYSQRVELAKADVRKQEAENEFLAGRLARAKQLVEKKAISREEFERSEADYKKGLAESDVLKAKVGEQEAMLDVVRSLIEGGQAVPLCAE